MRNSSLAHISLLWFLGILPCLLLNAESLRSASDGTVEKKIIRLIEDLSNDRFDTREAATRALMDLEVEPSALREAAKSSDLEVRRRVARILKVLNQKRARRCLTRARSLAKAGRIIEATDRVAYWGEWDRSGDGWDILTRFADRVIMNTTRCSSSTSFRPNTDFPAGDFRRFANLVHPKEISQRKVDIDLGSDRSLNQKQKDAHKLFSETRGITTAHKIITNLWPQHTGLKDDKSSSSHARGDAAADA